MDQELYIDTSLKNPLLHIQPTINGISARFREKPRWSLYLGCGLTTMKSPTVSVPFDILMFILSVRDLQKNFELDAVHCLIADTHTLSNQFCHFCN